ncbi:hypothetical protein OIV83_002892 [Microbotryomycetes sp. JL201]|nr:hypothetical protein OIV83_002892 [Microbotryomycetes sp. JL201]
MSDAALKRDNVAVVTGAAVGGIGYSIARVLLERYGLRVVLSDVSVDLLDQTARELVKAGIAEERFMTHTTDVTNFSEVQQLADVAFETFGKVDVLVLNAGASRPSKDFVSQDEVQSNLEAWHSILNVNLFGVLHGTQSFVDRMVQQDSPAAIVITGSKQGITQPPGNPACNLHSTRVSVRLLVPGYTYTKLTGSSPAKDKPAAAWWPEQVAEELFARWNEFYIICPDNSVSSELDSARMQWSMGDIIEKRPALSRWHPDYKEAFNQFIEEKTGQK